LNGLLSIWSPEEESTVVVLRADIAGAGPGEAVVTGFDTRLVNVDLVPQK
jgi:hypothetical protein